MSIELATEAEMLRSSHISRWGIVQVAVRQNIAEHMYRVWLLVREWGPLVGLDAKQQALAEQFALMHDLPEIRTGDAPTPHKTPAIKAYLSKVEAEILPSLAILQEQLTPAIRELVKFCDTAESVLFLQVNGLGGHAEEVGKLLEDQMLGRLADSSFSIEARASLAHRFHLTKLGT